MRRSSLVLLSLFALTSCEPPPATAVDTATANPIPPTVSAQRRTPVVQVVQSVMPAVVNIRTEGTMRQRTVDPFFGFYGRDRTFPTQSVGSGFVWAPDGILVTNSHVIEGASTIIANMHDGRQLEARVIGVDPDSDLAVLRVEASQLPAIPIGTSSDLLIGETVIAVGNPFGLSGTVTTGVISATGRSVPAQEQGRTFTDFIQTDASINPGNSGGPLLNIEGKVIGINVAIYAEAQNIGFAIPVDRARKIIEDLRRFGSVQNVWIGAVTVTITPEEARRLELEATRGALVTRIFSDSPADRAGLRVGDIIVGAGNTIVESRDAFSTLTATAATGRSIRIRVRRNGDPLELLITPTNPPLDLGLQILEQIGGLEVGQSANRVEVREVRRGSRAANIGLAPGDQIVAVGGANVSSVDELNQQISRSSEHTAVVLSIRRGRFIYTISFPMGG